MTPNFALSLSLEGIRLLHRVTGGWALAGQVTLDAADLGASMKTLRDGAIVLEPDGLRTKLLLPNDQIKYIEIDTARTSIDDIYAAVDRATPIPLDELVIDFDRTGGRTQIAAVARQTLDEAEAFAKEHGFAPMTFVAVAAPLTFSTEVFFGATAYARDVLGPDVEITRDDSPAILPSIGTLPGFMKLPFAETLPATDNMPPTEPNPIDSKPLPDTEDTPADADPDPVGELVFRRERAPTTDETPTDVEDIKSVNGDEPTKDDPVFTRHTNSRPVEISGARRVPAPPESKEGLEKTDNIRPDRDPIAFFTRSASTTKPLIEPVLSTSEPDAPAIPSPLTVSQPESAKEDTPVLAGPKRDPQTVESKSNGFAPLLTFFRKPQEKKPTNADFALGGAKGRKLSPAVGGKPKYLGLMMTAALLVLMFIIAMWASSRLENGIAGLFSTPTIQDVAEVAAPVLAQPTITETPAAAKATTVSQPVMTRIRGGTVLSPAEAARIYAATGVWQRAPRLPNYTKTGSLDGLLQFATLPLVVPTTRPAAPDITIAAPDRTILPPQNPTAPDLTIQRDERGFILAARTGTILPTGILIYGRKPEITPPLRPEPEVPVIATAVPAEPVPETPETVERDPVEAPVDTVAEPPELAATTDEPATTGEGLIVINGSPALTPPLRPGSTPPDASAEAGNLLGNDPALAAFRPSLRPDGLVPPPPPEPFADPALTGFRPSVRPADLAPPPIEEDEALIAEEQATPDVPLGGTDISSIVASIAAAAPQSQIVSPTPNAIVASPRPGSRPRNFAQVVSSAQTLAARQQTRNEAASTAAAAVPTVSVASAPARQSEPTTASVAQAATLSNAIRLGDMNLIGVYGRPGNRRALVRFGNGRFVKVEVGSTLDGGQVTAIGDSALNFVKSGQLYALQLPAG